MNVIGIDYVIRQADDRDQGVWIWVTMSKKYGFQIHTTRRFPDGEEPTPTSEEQKLIDKLRGYFDEGGELTTDAIEAFLA